MPVILFIFYLFVHTISPNVFNEFQWHFGEELDTGQGVIGYILWVDLEDFDFVNIGNLGIIFYYYFLEKYFLNYFLLL